MTKCISDDKIKEISSSLEIDDEEIHRHLSVCSSCYEKYCNEMTIASSARIQEIKMQMRNIAYFLSNPV